MNGKKHFKRGLSCLLAMIILTGKNLPFSSQMQAFAGNMTQGWTLGGGEIRSGEIGGGEIHSGETSGEDQSASESGSLQELSVSAGPSGGLAVQQPSEPMELLSSSEAEQLQEMMASYAASEESLLVNNAQTYYYYEELNPVSRQIYDTMYQVCTDPASEGNVGLMITDLNPDGEEFYTDVNLAYLALCLDHPELFWLYAGNEADMLFGSEAVVENGVYYVYIFMEEPYTGFEAAMTRFNQAADAFLEDIDTSGSEYDTIRQIHDKLIDLVNYDDPVAETTFSGKGQDLAHTAYGCLVQDSEGIDHAAVCDGYAFCLEYMLQQCGIESCVIVGMAGEDEASASGHAWNLVKMDGSWYEVDSTWDDSGSVLDDYTPGTEAYGVFEEALSDSAFRELNDHYLFLVSTARISNFVPGDEFVYTTKDNRYTVQLSGASVHRRMNDFPDISPYEAQVAALAPTAMMNYTG